MKLIKMFGLAMVAAVVAMAFVGASTASAESTVLCKSTTNPCPAADEYVLGHVEALNLGEVELLGVANVKCSHSVILGEALHLGSPLVIHVTLLDFSNCSCTTNVIDQTGLIEALREGGDVAGGTASGFEVLVECIGVHCVFGGVAGGAKAAGGAPATIKAEKVELKRLAGGFFCGSKAFWDATYDIILPNPIHFEK